MEKSKLMPMFVLIKEMEIEVNILTNYFITRDIKLKQQTHGWTIIDLYSIDSTQQQPVG